MPHRRHSFRATTSLRRCWDFRYGSSTAERRALPRGRNTFKQVPEQFNFNTRAAFYRAVLTGEEYKLQGVASDVSAAYELRSNTVIDSLATLPGVHIVDADQIS